MDSQIIEDYTSFQPECMSMTSGSISFGRFETESLSWERNSSFSHNRYLEEVEKYSTPGSVTQKKAYFEAHFKKKGLLNQANSFSQNVNEDQTNVYEDDYNDEIQFDDFQNQNNDGVQFSWYDETPILSGELQHDVIDGEVEELSSVSRMPVEQTPLEDIKSEINAQQPDCVIAKSQIQSELLSVRDLSIPETVAENKTTKEAETKDGHSEVEVSSVKTNPLVKTNHLVLNKSSKSSTKVKTKTTLDQKPSKSIKSQSNGIGRPQKAFENKNFSSVQASTKTPKKLQTNGSLTKIQKKQIHLGTSPLPNSANRTFKSEDLKSAKPAGRLNSKSMKNCEKSLIAKKDGVTTQSTSGTGENSIKRHASGPKRGPNLANPESEISGVVFNFKSYERAEKRKEYFMKLEERLHAKETKINEIHTKTQVETQAALKQFRKSLNFKATPMPSFYIHEMGKRISGGKKQSSQKAIGTKIVKRTDPFSNLCNSNQLSPTEAVLDVRIGESSKREEMVGIIRVESHSSKKNEVGKRDNKVKSQQQQRQKGENSHNKLKKDEKTCKVKNISSGKVMREGKSSRGGRMVVTC